MRIVYAYMSSGETVRIEVEDDWQITFGTTAGNRGMGAHELRVYSDGKKNQRMALTNVVSFWEESLNMKRVVIDKTEKAKTTPAVAVPGQMSTEDFPELYEEDPDAA